MKRRKTKLWKKMLVGFMSFTMFLGNLSSLSVEAFAAEEGLFDEAEGSEDGVFIDSGEFDSVLTVSDGSELNASANEDFDSPLFNEDIENSPENEISDPDNDNTDPELTVEEAPESSDLQSDTDITADNDNPDDNDAAEEQVVPARSLYKLNVSVLDADGDPIPGYEDSVIPDFDGNLDLTNRLDPPIRVENYNFVEAKLGNNVIESLCKNDEGYISSLISGGETYTIDLDVDLDLYYESKYQVTELKATIVDEFGDTVDDKLSDMDLPSFNDEDILVLDDPGLPPVENVKVRSGLFRSVKYTYVKASYDGKTIKALRTQPAVKGEGNYYAYTVDGTEWTYFDKDSTILFEYTDGKKSVYTYEDSKVAVTATLQHANAVPDDAYFAVTPVVKGSSYDVDSYIDALNKEAVPENASAGFEYSMDNTLLYDIAFYTDETKSEEIQPADGMVKIEMQFLKNQLKDELDASADSGLLVNHLSLDESVLTDAGTTAAAEVRSDDISVETIDANVSVSDGSVEFKTESFSIYTITDIGDDIAGQIVIDYDFAPDTLPLGVIFISGSNNPNAHVILKLADYLQGDKVMITSEGLARTNVGGLESGVTYSIELWKAVSSEKYNSFNPDNNFEKNDFSRVIYNSYNFDRTYQVKEGTDEWGQDTYSYYTENVTAEPQNSGIIDMYSYSMPASGEVSDGTIRITATRVPVNDKVIPATILRDAVNFGVVANTYENVNDTQSNFATKLYIGGNDVGADMSNNPGTTYIAEFSGTGLNIRNNLGSSALLIGCNVSQTTEQDTARLYTVPDKDGQPYTIYDKSKKADVINVGKDTVNRKIDNLISGVSIPAGNKVVLPKATLASGDPEYYLDTTSLPDGTIHFDLDNSTGAEGKSLYEVWSTSQKVYIKKNPDQTLIFHSNQSQITLCEYNVYDWSNGKYETSASPTTSGDKNERLLNNVASTMVFDFPNASTLDFASAITGMVIAPKAHVTWSTACCGWLICDYAEGRGEWHFVSQDVPSVTDDHTTLKLDIVKTLIDDNVPSGETNIDSLWPEEGFKFRITKYAAGSIEGDQNGYEVMHDVNKIPDLDGMVNGEKIVTITKDQAGKKVTVGTHDFTGSEEWEKTSLTYEDHRYYAFMYKVEELPCGNSDIEPYPTNTYFVKFFINIRQVVNGDDIKYYVWVDGPHVSGTVLVSNSCIPKDIEFENHYNPEHRNINVTKNWSDGNNNHSNDSVIVQLTVKEQDGYKDVPGQTAVLNAANNWSATYTNLLFDKEYSVREVSVNGETVTVNNGKTTIKVGNVDYTVAVTGNENSGFTVTNTKPGKGRLCIAKWANLGVTTGNLQTLRNNIKFEIWDVETNTKLGEATHWHADAYDYYFDNLEYGKVYRVVEKDYAMDGKTLVATYQYPMAASRENDSSKYYSIANNDYVLHDDASLTDEPGKSDEFIFTEANPNLILFNKYAGQGNLRIHKIVVNDFGSDLVRDAGYSILQNCVFRLTSTDNPKDYIVFQTIIKGSDNRIEPGRAVGYGAFAGQTYDVEYNQNAQWTVYNIPSGQYYVEEVADGYTFLYDASTNTSSIKPTTEYSRVTHYGVTTDEMPGSYRFAKGGDNVRILASYELGKEGQESSIPTAVVDPWGNNIQTVQVSNFYSNPLAPVEVTKAYSGWEDGLDTNSTFSFKLTAGSNDAHDSTGNPVSVATPMPASDTVTVSFGDYNSESKTATGNFGSIDYRYEGTYNYTIEEVIPEGAVEITVPSSDGKKGYLKDGVIYDKRTINVQVEVTQMDTTFRKTSNPNGTLRSDYAPDNGTKEYTYDEVFYYLGSTVIYSEGNTKIGKTTMTLPENIDTAGSMDKYVKTTEWSDRKCLFSNLREELISISGTKVWDDADNRDGLRDNIVFTLTSDDPGFAAQTRTISKDSTNLKWSFENLPKYNSAGQLINYTVEETTQIDGYSTTVNDNNENTITVNGENGNTSEVEFKNTHTPQSTSVTVEKKWEDKNNQDGKRPDAVMVTLMANGTAEGNAVKLEDNNQWTHTWKDLPVYQGGVAIAYTVEESAVNSGDLEGYSLTPSTATSDDGTTITLTNTYSPETVRLNGKKIWKDALNEETENEIQDADRIRPDSVTIIIKDGKNEIGRTTASKETGWAWSYPAEGETLDKFRNGQIINYTIEEVAVPEYSATYDGYDITNTHKPERIDIPVTKVWADNNDQDGVRPASVTIRLLRNDNDTGRTVTLNEANHWTDSFTNLEKYEFVKNSDGTFTKNTIDYSVKEDGADSDSITFDGAKYAVSMSGSAETGFTVTNTHTPEETEKPAVKVWDDDKDRDGCRPDSIKLQLYADTGVNGTDVPVGDPVTVSPGSKHGEENKTKVSSDESGRDTWTYTFTGLDKYRRILGEDGKPVGDPVEIRYTIKEIVDEATAKKYNLAVVDGETMSVDPVYSEDHLTVTNIHIPETTEIEIKKVWDDASDQDGIRPDRVKLQLYADGEAKGEPIVLSPGSNGVSISEDGNTWSYRISGLTRFSGNKHDNGNPVPISYTIEEITVDTTTDPATDLLKGYTPSKMNGHSIKNSHTPETVSIPVKKIWNDEHNIAGLRPSKITIKLWQDEVVEYGKPYETHELSGGLTDEAWTYTFTDLPKYKTVTENGQKTGGHEIKYIVTEEGYNTDHYTANASEIDTLATDGYYTFNNSYKVEYVSVEGKKVWNDSSNAHNSRPGSIELKLYKTIGTSEEKQLVDTYTITPSANDAEQDEWSWTIDSFTKTDKDSGITHILLKYENGKRVHYSVEETPVDNYDTPVVVSGKEDTESGNVSEVKITNTYNPGSKSVSVHKTWDDSNDQDGKRPQSITVYLIKRYADSKETIVTQSEELNAGNAWSYTWENLPTRYSNRDVEYVVDEAQISVPDKYTSIVDGYEITNTYIPETINISGTKVWDDDDNRDGKRRNAVINLYKNVYTTDESGQKTVQKVFVGSDIAYIYGAEEKPADKPVDTWAFNNLPKYDKGEEIEYFVSEEPIDSYTTTANKSFVSEADKEIRVSGESVKNITFTNTHVTYKTSVPVTKIWDDNRDQDGKRPDEVTINLLANGKLVTSHDLTVEDMESAQNTNVWTYTFGKTSDGKDTLPIYENGKKIEYTIEEVINGSEVDGESESVKKYVLGKDNVKYYVTQNDKTITNTYTPELIDIPVTKTWDDKENQDGIRPEKITLTLYAGNEEVRSETISGTEDVWSYTFKDLPKYANRTAIVYRVEESGQNSKVRDGETGYTLSFKEGSKFNLVNEHTPETTSVKGSKIWEDVGDQDGGRPESITVNLLVNGKTVDSKTVTSANEWKFEFTGLPKYANGRLITYTVEEDGAEGGQISFASGNDPQRQVEYIVTLDGYNITNTHKPETTEVSVTKVWEDDDNRAGKRPDNIKVSLYKGNELVSYKAEDAQEAVTEITLNESNHWTYTFTDLPKYDGGIEIAYSVKEKGDLPAGYSKSVTNEGNAFTITNTYAPDKVSVSGVKVWNDSYTDAFGNKTDNADGLRPDKVIVVLKADGQTVKTIETNATKHWAWEFTGLDKYKAGSHGEEIVYTVDEQTVSTGYSRTIGNSILKDENGDAVKDDEGNSVIVPNEWVITNTHVPVRTSVEVEKIWQDNDDQDGGRPGSITVQLYADGQAVEGRTAELNAGNNWKASFTDLKKYSDGVSVPINYTIRETGTSTETDGNETKEYVTFSRNDKSYKYYVTTDGGLTESGDRYVYSITNEYTPETTSVKVTKIWDDGNDQDKLRPDSIVIKLFADNELKESKTITGASIDENGNWTCEFTDLPKYKTVTENEITTGGHSITYTVQEEKVSVTRRNGQTVDYSASVTGNMITGYTITNSYEPEKISIEGIKTWKDGEDQDGIRPDSVIIVVTDNKSHKEAGKVTATKENNWKWKIEGLDRYHDGEPASYTVAEYDTISEKVTDETTGEEKTVLRAKDRNGNASYVVSSGRTGSLDTSSGNISDVEFVNTYVPRTVDLAGKKFWSDASDQDGKRPESIIIDILKVYGEGENRTEKLVKSITVSKPEGQTVNEWSWEEKGLPENEILEDADGRTGGHRINYTVRERISGKDENGEYIFGNDSAKYYVSQSGNDITNTYTPTTVDIEGTKTWIDDNNAENKRLSSITIRFWKPDSTSGTGISEAAHKTVTADDGWSWKFEKLPEYESGQKITYTISEDSVEDYTATVDGSNVINTYTPGKTGVTVTKTWSDDDDRDGIRPGSLKVTLYANGVEKTDITPVIAKAGNVWTYTYNDLDKVDADGKVIKYTVSEEKVEGYNNGEAAVPTTTDEKYGCSWSLTNRHDVEKISVRGSKIWSDSGDQDGYRPGSINITLTGTVGGETVFAETKNVSGTGSSWSWSFDDLYKYYKGKPIDYSVTEDYTLPEGAPAGAYRLTTPQSELTASAAEADADGTLKFTLKNEHEIETTVLSGSKIWRDNDDQDGLRPASVTIQLMADNVEMAGKTVTLPINDKWDYEFKNLPKNRAGKSGEAVVYSVTEKEVPAGYRSEPDGSNIINTHIPDTTDVTVTKFWDDDGNRDGIRPDSVEIQLYAGDEKYGDPVVIQAVDNWTYTFRGLPLNKDGAAIQYNVKEVSVRDKNGDTTTYKAKYDNRNNTDIKVTNIHTPEAVNLTIEKNWIGEPAVNTVNVRVIGKVGDKVVVGGDGSPIRGVLNDVNGWKLTISGTRVSGDTTTIVLPRYYENRQLITYYVIEDTDVSYIQTDASGKALSADKNETAFVEKSGRLIAELYNMSLTSLQVTKIWKNDPGFFGGGKVEVGLVRTIGTDSTIIEKVELNKANSWSHVFEDLPVFDASGNKYGYRVKELTDLTGEGYAEPSDNYSDKIEGYPDNKAEIVNELTPLTLKLQKEWYADTESARPAQIKVEILTNVQTGTTTTSVFDRIKKVFGVDSDKWYRYGDPVTLTAADGWKAEVKDLPRYVMVGNEAVEVSYAVAELEVPDGYSSSTAVKGDTAIIMNTGDTAVSGFKVWDDDSNVMGYRPDSASFAKVIALYMDGGKEPYLTGESTDHFKWIDATGDAWSFQFYGLPAGHKYTIGETAQVRGYRKGVVDATANRITNTLDFTQLTVRKVWDDSDNAYASRPANISFRLLANGSQASVPGVNPIVTLGNDNGASYTWKNLPVLDKKGNTIAYTAEEINVPAGYAASLSISGTTVTITNRFTPEYTSLTVRKVWDDQNDSAKLRPAGIQVALTRNGTDVETVTLSASNSWSHTWNDLPVVLADGTGNRVSYSVREITGIPGYSVTVSGSGTSYTITNYYRPPSTPDTPPTTPDTPPTTPDTPPSTPDTPPSTPDNPPTPTQEPYNIPDEPTPLAGLSQVLGARRAAGGAVLGARRSPQTGDQSNAAAFMAAMASAGAMMGAWFAMRKKRKG